MLHAHVANTVYLISLQSRIDCSHAPHRFFFSHFRSGVLLTHSMMQKQHLSRRSAVHQRSHLAMATIGRECLQASAHFRMDSRRLDNKAIRSCVHAHAKVTCIGQSLARVNCKRLSYEFCEPKRARALHLTELENCVLNYILSNNE